MTLTVVIAKAGTSAAGGKTSAGSGQLVQSFGDGGRLFSDLTQGSHATAVASMGRKILVAGAAPSSDGTRPATLVRYLANGEIDRSFGKRGVATVPACAIEAIKAETNGAILAAGGCQNGFGVIRLTSDGQLNGSFGDRGVANVELDFGQELARSLAVDSQGRIIVAGETQDARNGRRYVALARFTPEGEVDISFGDGGSLYTSFGEPVDTRAFAVGVQSDGKPVIGGNVAGSWILARFTEDGQIDSGFGVNGVEYRGPVEAGVVRALEILPGDRILTAGTQYDNPGSRMAAVRYLADGQTDTSFGAGDGKTTVTYAKRHVPYDGATSMVRDDGKIYLGGFARSDRLKSREAIDFAIARLKSNGEIDRSFSGDGRTATNMRPGGNKRHTDEAFGVAVTSNGDPVLAGESNRKRDYGTKIALAKYHGSGRR